MVGYSGTPLATKLGFTAPLRVFTISAPPDYLEWLGPEAHGVDFDPQQPRPYQAVHLFTDSRAELTTLLTDLRHAIEPSGMIWVSWPKKSSGVATDISEDVIHTVCLPLGLVDIKVCAVSETYSGLKLVIRRDLRK